MRVCEGDGCGHILVRCGERAEGDERVSGLVGVVYGDGWCSQ
jgi:hypothetical protein